VKFGSLRTTNTNMPTLQTKKSTENVLILNNNDIKNIAKT